jgi:hypothetical protein
MSPVNKSGTLKMEDLRAALFIAQEKGYSEGTMS